MDKNELTRMQRIRKWLENYWYHYKIVTIMVVFFVTVILICTAQMLSKVDDDVCILYAGPAEFTANETREIQNAFRFVMGDDLNGDGEKQVELVNLLLMTDEQIQEAKDNANAEGNILYYSQYTINENRNKYTTQIFAGETSICLLDPNWYDNVKESGGFAKLSDVLGYTPEFALDDYSVRLADTRFAQYFTAISHYPEDTLLCIRLSSTVTMFKSQKKEDARYANQCEMFRRIFAFDLVPETMAPGTEASAPESTSGAE